MKKSRGFTLIELLVVVSIIALLISILLPSLGKAKELANRAHCAANIRGIVQSLIVYSQFNDTSFPAPLPTAADKTYLLAWGTGVSPSADKTLQGTSATNGAYYSPGNPLAALWILNLHRLAQPKLFLCKSDRYAGGPAPVIDGSGNYYNGFSETTGSQVSYAIADPWSAKNSLAPWWRGKDMDSATALVSDVPPFNPGSALSRGDPNMKTNNSPNHDGAGQNVGFGDSHVDFAKDPYVGPGGDNIFTNRVTPDIVTGLPAASDPGFFIAADGALPKNNPSAIYPYDIVMIPTRSTTDGSLH